MVELTLQDIFPFTKKDFYRFYECQSMPSPLDMSYRINFIIKDSIQRKLLRIRFKVTLYEILEKPKVYHSTKQYIYEKGILFLRELINIANIGWNKYKRINGD